jgi:hypothetical protein
MRTLAILLLTIVPAVAEETKKKAPAVQSVPAGAERVDANTFRHKDAQGKVWIYRQTPFGVVKFEENKNEPATVGGRRATPWGTVKVDGSAPPKADPEAEAKQASLITVTEEGDSLRFERTSPFGKFSWNRKKTELNEDEKAAWERSRASQSADRAKQ